MQRTKRINDILTTQIMPLKLLVENESASHNVPADSESHFKVTAVANKFQQLSLIERHRYINTLLENEFKTGLHALSLHLYTPDEWQRKQGITLDSPKCKNKS